MSATIARKTVFLMSGQGSQYFQMGRLLYDSEPVFREQMDRLDEAAQFSLGDSIVRILYTQGRGRGGDFSRTVHTHPAIFMVEFALAQALMARGVHPDYLLGSSLGEFVAAALTGAVAAEAMLAALIEQAHAVERHCQPGMMLTILHDPALYDSDPVLHQRSTLAGINYDRHFVVSGVREQLEMVLRHLQGLGISAIKLPISHGFHSPAIDAARAAVPLASASLDFAPPRVPVISCRTGARVEALSDEHFRKVGREPILFREALQHVLKTESGDLDFVDIGPAGTLAGFVRQHLPDGGGHRTFTVMSPFIDDREGFRQVTQQLAAGAVGTATGARSQQMIAYIFPGQGAQKKGMGQGLFERFPDLVRQADALLGYSIRELCVEDPRRQLDQTLYTQPALYVVNALTYLSERASAVRGPDFVAGHSLGEYDALFAAGMVDFETGLKLVQRRAKLMSQARDGAMAAVIGLDAEAIRRSLAAAGLDQVDLANLNTPSQIVISGAREDVLKARPVLEATPGCRMVMPLTVSGAFHSRLMAAAQSEFEAFLAPFVFSEPLVPVISNVSARPYTLDSAKALLARQITQPVNWVESIRYMWGQGVEEFKECGYGKVLTGLVTKIRAEAAPLLEAVPAPAAASPARVLAEPLIAAPPGTLEPPARQAGISAASLGSRHFKADYQVQYAYVAGAMVHGIASAAMVIRMGRAGMLSYFGSGGLAPGAVEQAIVQIQQALQPGQPYGVNLLNGSHEEANVALFLKHGVRNVEASAYLQMTSGLVRYRLCGLERAGDGNVLARNRIMAKLSRPEIAAAFLNPAPERIVRRLLEQGLVSAQQAEWSTQVPMADDICVEADSGGHTDRGVAATLLPAIQRQRDAAMAAHAYRKPIRVGCAGGIGTPEAAAAAFVLGADFILTGSINQCTVEAGTSELVKDLLQEMQVQDTDYAPAGDMFEIGARVQVLKRGLFFPVRANKLYELYRSVDSIEQIDQGTARMIQEKYFQRSFAEVYEECRRHHDAAQIAAADQHPKKKMALIFRWYFGHANRLALQGDADHKVDFQIHCGPALGGFNQWVKGTPLENWRRRHADEIGLKLMDDTARLLMRRFGALFEQDAAPPIERRVADCVE